MRGRTSPDKKKNTRAETLGFEHGENVVALAPSTRQAISNNLTTKSIDLKAYLYMAILDMSHMH
jgi:hypothetical protein